MAASKKRAARVARGVAGPSRSPLFRSAMEVLEHGLWHYFRTDTPTDLKFALMHVDQAIELLMKECIRAKGISINKKGNTKETITIWGAYEILTEQLKIAIPERADLELLHEERNNIQHKYLNPDPESASFHVENGVKFIRRFLKDQLSADIYEFVSSEYLDAFFATPEQSGKSSSSSS